MPHERRLAPDFSLQADDGSTVTRDSLLGTPAVLYFYPRDNTPGCTVEASEFRDAFPRFEQDGVRIIGISPDTVESHVKFKKKFELPFTLLADTGHAMAEAYGVWKEKNMYGTKLWGIERTTFILDKEGRIVKTFNKVKPEGHAAQVSNSLKKLQ